MEQFITGGSVTAVILAVLVIEAVIVSVYLVRTGRTLRLPGFLAGLAAGGCLVLALREALTNGGWVMIAIFLSLSFLAHAIELALRLWGTASDPTNFPPRI